MKRVIGITGGIASGKSTVVKMVRQAGYPVIDADQLVHDLQQKGGQLYQALLDFFGQDILLPSGELNRPYLSQLIFSNPDNREASSRLQNQIIRDNLAQRRDEALTQHDLVFMDIPLLFELGYEAWFDQIWLVYVSKDTQLQRLVARGNYTAEEASQRIASQMPLADKCSLASHVINNDGSLLEIQAQVSALLAELSQKST